MIKTIRWAGIEQKKALKPTVGEWPQIALFNFMYFILFISPFLFYIFNSIKNSFTQQRFFECLLCAIRRLSEHRRGVKVASKSTLPFSGHGILANCVCSVSLSYLFFFLQKWYPSQSLLKDFGLWNANNKWSIKEGLKMFKVSFSISSKKIYYCVLGH